MSAHSDLTKTYPLITIDKILGEPRLVGKRISVGDVLTFITLYGSFDEILDEYEENGLTKEQLTQAVQFARDFLDSFYAPPPPAGLD